MADFRLGLVVFLCAALPAYSQVTTRPASSYTLPHNYFGAHLLVDSATGKAGQHLRWARQLVGRWGHAKTLLAGIENNTRGPTPGWIEYVQRCYDLEMVPVLRLGGKFQNGQWNQPKADAPREYRSMARAIRSVVGGLPRSDKCPLYIELWNEPNLAIEWSGRPDPAEYAAFFVQASRAIRDIGDKRIVVLNGGLATSPEWAEQLSKAEPDFLSAFDVWACHPYPANRPSWINHHNAKAPAGSEMTIDSYLLELNVLRRMGRSNVKVMITETGYDLGNSVYTRSERHPIIDECNRADYMVRAFRDFYPTWPEVVAVFPFEFCDPGWERFNWVHPDSETNEDGTPTRPHYQYTAVAALAKPTDVTGAVSGTIRAAGVAAPLEGVSVTGGGQRFTSDAVGNYFLAKLAPGSHRVEVRKAGFRTVSRDLRVTAGANTVFDVEMVATRKETLSGVVRDSDHDRPVAHVKVTLEPGGQSVRTNSNGEYRFTNVVPATYRLAAESNGWYRYDAESVTVASGKANTWDFRLGRLPRVSGENLINNPSMEAGGGGAARKGLALSFEPGNDQGGKEEAAAINERLAHTGRMSQELRVRQAEAIVRQMTHYNTVQPGERYTAGIWIRTDIADRDGAAWMTLEFTDNGGKLIRREEPAKRAEGRSREWVWMSVDGVAPEGAQRMSISLHTQGKGGSACFDDAHLAQVSRKR